jgi:hypothetical protein
MDIHNKRVLITGAGVRTAWDIESLHSDAAPLGVRLIAITYCATKAALLSLGQALRAYLSDKGVRVITTIRAHSRLILLGPRASRPHWQRQMISGR